jgi:hypothetical protein
MRISGLMLLATALLLGGAAAASAAPANPANDVLLGAMSPFEDLVEYALAGSDADVAKALVAADQQAASARQALPATAASVLATRMQGLHNAAGAKNHYGVASNAVEVFRLLTDNLQTKDLALPKEVSLLDYAGFKLRVLAAAPSPNWQDIGKTATDAAGWWNAIRPKLPAGGLRDGLDTAARGLGDATRSKDLAMVRFGAQVELDLVDLLEGALAPKP